MLTSAGVLARNMVSCRRRIWISPFPYLNLHQIAMLLRLVGGAHDSNCTTTKPCLRLTFIIASGLDWRFFTFRCSKEEDMPKGPSIVMAADSRSGSGPGMSTSIVRRVISHGLVNKHCKAIMLVLAIAVALWGFGYKISLYHPDPNHAVRASVAKLWIERRCAEIVAHFGQTVPPRSSADSQFLPVVPHAPRRLHEFLFSNRSSYLRAFSVVASLIPSRAPPSQPFFLA